MVLDDDFELVHGASTWYYAFSYAERRGARICANPPSVCVAVAHRLGTYEGDPRIPIAWVGAVNTDANIVLYEWLVTNPNWRARDTHRAVEHLMRAGLVYATAVGKRPVMLNVPRGVRMIAERVGFASGKTFEVLMGEMP